MKNVVSLRLSPEALAALDAEAARRGTNRSRLVEQVALDFGGSPPAEPSVGSPPAETPAPVRRESSVPKFGGSARREPKPTGKSKWGYDPMAKLRSKGG